MFKSYSAGRESFRLDLQNPKGILNQETFDQVLQYLGSKSNEIFLNPIENQFVPQNSELMMAFAETERTRLCGYSFGTEEDSFKAVFELLERYLFSENDKFLDFEPWQETYAENFSVKDQQRKIKPYRAVKGLRVNTLEEVSLDSYYFGFEENHHAFTSIGCAVHSDSMLALQGAISEQMENFVISKHILNGLAPRKLLGAEQFLPEQSHLSHLKEQGYEMMTLGFLDFGYPAFVSFILKEDGGFPYLFYGVGCDPDVMKAIEKSMREAIMVWILEAPNAKKNVDQRENLDADLSKSPLYYQQNYCQNHFPEWLNASGIQIEEVLNSVDPSQYVSLAGEMDFIAFPLISECENITWIRLLSEKIIPKTYSFHPYLPSCDIVQQPEKLFNYPY